MRGSKIVGDIFEWMDLNEGKDYQSYLGLVMMAYITHDFWWYQRGDLQSSIEGKDLEAVQAFKLKCKEDKNYKLQ